MFVNYCTNLNGVEAPLFPKYNIKSLFPISKVIRATLKDQWWDDNKYP